MAVIHHPTDAQVAELLERLAAARDVVDAASMVLDRAMREAGFERAVAALRVDDEIRGAGWGVPGRRLKRLLETSEDFDSLLSTSEPTPIGEAAVLAQLGFDHGVALPFGGGPESPLGVVIVEAEAHSESTGFVAELFGRCAPALEKTLAVDVSARRVRKLSQQRDLLTGIVNGLADPVLLTNSQNDIILANQRAEHLLSAGPEDSEGRRRAVQVNNLLFTSFLTQTVIGSTSPTSRELNLVDPSDGSDLLFEVLSAPAPGTGQEAAVVSILRDITDLKRAVTELESQFSRSRGAEHRARHERDRLNAMLENVGDPILVTDDQSNLILMNREADRLFVASAAPEGDSPKRRLVRANDTKFTSLISDFLLQVGDRRVEALELTDPDSGREFAAEAVSSKILNDRGEPTAIVTIIHDLTQVVENQRLARELKELNEDLEDRIRAATRELAERNQRLEWQSRELEKASRLKSEFLANMSHELRTPINALLGYTALMQERIYGDLTPKQDVALEKIRNASRHLLELINDILDLSKIEAGKMQIHVERVALEEIAHELAETLQPLVAQKGIEYNQRIEAGIPPLWTDRTKVKQILLNLLSNAVKFTPAGEVELDIGWGGGKDRVRVRVRDTGIGIEPTQLDGIFEEFRQVDGSHTREYGGTGLGLSITRKLIGLLGGEISVESAPGEGSTFTIELPLRAEPALIDSA